MENDREWTDFNAQAGALESATTQDCATACKALESLTRAAEHICAVAPDHCDEARARVRSATDRVRAACPQCETRTADNDVHAGQTTSEVKVQAAAPEHGGCAGCATGAMPSDAGLAAFALALLAGIRRRRGRRNDLRRVRDALRVEADPH
jgi:MYXO-CTERM domain-containing protein